jgi:outer membrane protein assembly factor BamB
VTRRVSRLLVAGSATGALVLALTTHASNQESTDWPQWRGQHRDGKSAETGLLSTWPDGGPPLRWETEGAGAGYSSMSAVGSRLYTMGARGDTEYVMAFDRASGRKLWEVANGERFSNDRGDGPRGTPTVDGNRLYALGGSGSLACLDAESGSRVWSVNVLETFGGRNPRWGLSESPLVTADRVIVNAGGPEASVVAFDKANGDVIWKTQSDPAAYSSAILHEVGGIPQVVVFTARRAIGVDSRDGRLLWEYDKVSNRVANIATPVVEDNFVFLSSDYGTGAALLKLEPHGDAVTATEVYFTKDMRNHHSSSILVGDHLYGFSSAILTALDFDTGEVTWRARSVGKGSMAYADGHLYLYSENGVVGYQETGRFEITQSSLPTWAHPIISAGTLYLRDQDAIYAYDVREGT